jgi:hypothetical protein
MKKGFFDQNDDHWIVPIADKHGNNLDLHKNRVHSARHKYDREKKLQFNVKRLVWCQQSNALSKIIVLEGIEWESDKRTELRMAYYTTSRTGHWWWGQFALMIPREDLEELLRYGREKGLLSN